MTDPHRVAILDLGTNTFNLLVGEYPLWESGWGIKRVFTDRVSVKLGKEKIGKRVIAGEAKKRGVNALEKLLRSARSWEPHEIIAMGTSGIRSAENGDLFLQEIREYTGITPAIIDGEREAELIAEGVRAALPLEKENSLILDIGGGSSEFLIANDQRTHWKKSFEIGAARLLDEIAPSDPITEQEYHEVRRRTEEMMGPILEPLRDHPTQTLIGSSGSFESISDMAYYRYPDAASPEGKSAVEVSLSHFREIHQSLLNADMKERLEIKGLADIRAEMIVLGSIFIETVIEMAGIERLFTSYYSLREGVLMESARQNRKKAQ
ncbi:MAG: hypothetical protein ABEH38_00995 [Flavobacteriales bacterium]